MSTTHKSIRRKLNRIIEIKKLILPRLAEELQDLGARLPYDLCNTFRSRDFPGLKVVIVEPGSAGVRTDWQAVVHHLAHIYNIPHRGITSAVAAHSYRVAPSKEVSVQVKKDKLKDLDNAKGYVV